MFRNFQQNTERYLTLYREREGEELHHSQACMNDVYEFGEEMVLTICTGI